MNPYLELGQIVNVKGLKGEVKVNPFTENIERFEELKTVLIKFKNENKEFEIEKVGYHKNQVILKFKGINTVEEAEKLRNSYILIDRNDLEPLEEGVYYITDLLGLEVYTEDGTLLGKVDDIYNTGSNDIYVVKDDLGKQKLLPGIPEVLKNVDLEHGKTIVNLIFVSRSGSMFTAQSEMMRNRSFSGISKTDAWLSRLPSSFRPFSLSRMAFMKVEVCISPFMGISASPQ